MNEKSVVVGGLVKWRYMLEKCKLKIISKLVRFGIWVCGGEGRVKDIFEKFDAGNWVGVGVMFWR